MPLVQQQQTRQQIPAEILARFPGQQAGEMVDRYHTQGFLVLCPFLVVGCFGKVDGDGGVGESGPGVVDAHRVVRGGGIAGDVADDAEVPSRLTAGLAELVLGDEGRDGRVTQIDAIHEDVGFDDLVKGSPARRFGQVPFCDVAVRDAGAFEEGDGTGAAAAEGADYEDFWGRAVFEGGAEGGFDGG